MLVAGCGITPSPAPTGRSPTTLTIGLGLAPGGSSGAGIPSTVRNIAFEGLVAFHPDGRPDGRIAEQWTPSADGRSIRLKIRRGRFHDGEPITASIVRDILARELPAYMGQAFGDVEAIQVVADDELEFKLKQRSTFLIESLDLAITKGGQSPIGSGPFHPTGPLDADEVEMLAHEGHYAGKPAIDRIVLKSYTSVRSAWADMLRGQVDMLYDVGIEARDSLASSTRVKVFEFQRPYAYTVILNVNTPALRSAERPPRPEQLHRSGRADRRRTPRARCPGGWAQSGRSTGPTIPPPRRIRYAPQTLSGLKFSCIYVESTHERAGARARTAASIDRRRTDPDPALDGRGTRTAEFRQFRGGTDRRRQRTARAPVSVRGTRRVRAISVTTPARRSTRRSPPSSTPPTMPSTGPASRHFRTPSSPIRRRFFWRGASGPGR